MHIHKFGRFWIMAALTLMAALILGCQGASLKQTILGNPKGPFNIEGRVVDRETKQPIAYAVVTVLGKNAVDVETDANGTYSIPNLPQGVCSLLVWGEGWRDARKVVSVRSQHTTVNVALEPASVEDCTCVGRIRGKVVDYKNEPIPFAVIWIDSIRPTRGAQADAQGRYVVRNVPPGTYTVTVALTGWLPTTLQNVRVCANTTTALDATLCSSMSDGVLRAICRLKPNVSAPRPDARVAAAYTNHAGRIEGICTGGSMVAEFDDEPLVGLAVQVDNQVFCTETDAHGKYVLENIPIGTYTIALYTDGILWTTAKDVVVQDRNVTTVDFTTECKPAPEPCH